MSAKHRQGQAQHSAPKEAARRLGAKIKEARARTGLTQRECAALAGVSLPTLRGIEQGLSQPLFLPLARVAKVIRLRNPEFTLDDLLSLVMTMEEIVDALWREQREVIADKTATFGPAPKSFETRKQLLEMLGLLPIVENR